MRKSLKAPALRNGRRNRNGKHSVALVSLGCPKNLVDSEVMIARLAESGFVTGSDLAGADVVVINTCSFLEQAREEAEEWIRRASRLKRKGGIRALVVAGCLPALKRDRIMRDFPEVDAIVGPRDRLKISSACAAALDINHRGESFLGCTDDLVRTCHHRAVSTGKHSAYLKIAEGCDNNCAYCLIPRIRGRLRSRSMKSLLEEASALADCGVSELSLIAQDTTSYGGDLYGRPRLAALIKRLSGIEGIEWLRLLYTHPARLTDDVIETLAGIPKLCRYVDVPIQHASDKMLELMNRRTTQASLVGMLEKLRNSVPGISLRTTVMVGFPGEGKREFNELLEFIKHFKFDHLGAFAYSREEKTAAAGLPGHVSGGLKNERLKELMETQRRISRSRNAHLVGSEMNVLVDSVDAAAASAVARNEGQAPEIDGVVHVRAKNLRSGQFVRVLVEDSNAYDLFGKAIC